MQQNPSCHLSGWFFTALLFLLIPKSIYSLKEKTEKTDKVDSFFKKKLEQFQARWNSMQNITKEDEGMDSVLSNIRNINIY